jgi:photosystem II stability/assembly factor-like uncharacterized protein
VACDERLKSGVERRVLCASLLALPLLAGVATAAVPEESWVAPLASKTLLLDIAAYGDKRIAVGSRGHILVSNDAGASWTQSPHVPTLALLTAVTMIDAEHAWAVGHDEVILRTSDGGATWQKVHESIEAERPLLDVWFRDARHGIAIGAYSAYYVTADGGRTWAPQPFVAAAAADEEPPPDYHLNRIVAAGARLYIAAEAGHVYRSDDQGASWHVLPLPYDGSMFGLLPLAGDSLLVFGLRGNLFRSADAGASWAKLPTGTVAMLTAGVRLDDNTLAIVGLSGTVLVSRDAGHSFTLQQRADRKGLAAAVAAGDDALLVVGEAGIEPVALQ